MRAQPIAAPPNQTFAGDTCCPQLADDIIEVGLMRYLDGAIGVPTAPGLGARLDREKLNPYRDSGRPGSTPLLPNSRRADPAEDRGATVPY